MSEVVTRAEFDELRQMIEETYWYAKRAAAASIAEDSQKDWIRSVERHCDPVSRRYRTGTPLYTWNIAPKNSRPAQVLYENNLLTFEEVAAKGRASTARIKGVGARTLENIDAALSANGLTWAEAS